MSDHVRPKADTPLKQKTLLEGCSVRCEGCSFLFRFADLILITSGYDVIAGLQQVKRVWGWRKETAWSAWLLFSNSRYDKFMESPLFDHTTTTHLFTVCKHVLDFRNSYVAYAFSVHIFVFLRYCQNVFLIRRYTNELCLLHVLSSSRSSLRVEWKVWGVPPSRSTVRSRWVIGKYGVS